MTAVAARPTGLIPSPRASVENVPGQHPGLLLNPSGSRAVSYQRVLHQLVRRELRLLGELAAWAPADDVHRAAALTGHAELIGRLLLHHHDVERDSVWPALLRAVPRER